jgi:hypothetical protein
MYVFSKYYVEITHEKGKKIKVRGKTCEITHLVEVLHHLRLYVDVRSYQGGYLPASWGLSTTHLVEVLDLHNIDLHRLQIVRSY